MDITELAPLIVPTVSAAAVVLQNIGNRRNINRRLDKLEQNDNMLMMHDTHLPLSVRLDAGKRYIDMGGNGSAATYYEKLKEKYKEKVVKHMGETNE